MAARSLHNTFLRYAELFPPRLALVLKLYNNSNMHLLYACLAVLLAGLRLRAENNKLKKIDLVDVLKDVLRRNNDDYAEMEKNNKLLNSNKTSSTAITSTDVPKYEKVIAAIDKKNNIISGVKRRVGSGHSWEFDYGMNIVSSVVNKKPDNISALSKVPLRMSSIKKPAINHIKRNISRINIRNEIRVPKLNPTNDPVLIPKLPKKTNKKRIDRFKKLISKNKDSLKLLLSSKVETQTNKLELADGANVLRNEVKGRGGHEADDEEKLPSPDLLDMAPARGGRIHGLRFKGRLCHRHVLLPEGPKYDSGGRWYVPEHRLVARRAYDSTRPPRLLLPRCCNCCKKSVLGCE